MDENLVMANKIVSELKKLQDFIKVKEAELEKSSRLKTEKKSYNFEITVGDNTWDVVCDSVESVSDEKSDHLICIKDNEVIAEFWGVSAWIRSDVE